MRLECETVVAVPRHRVWEAVSDLAAYPDLIPGISRWEHRGGPRRGLGARYAMRMRVGSADVGGLIEVVEWDEGAELAWTNVLGLEQRGRWRLRDKGDRATRVVVRFAYSSPGVILGRVADAVAAPTVRRNLAASLARLRRLELAPGGAEGEDDAGGRPRTGRRPARRRPARR